MSHATDNRMTGTVHAHDPAPHHHVNYLGIFILLVVLTAVTVGAAFTPVVANGSELVKVFVALTIASIKAAFVALFFMHLKFEGKMIYIIVGVPLCLTVILVCALIPDIVMPAIHGTQLGAPHITHGH